MRKLRAFLLYYYTRKVSAWIQFEIENSLDLILKKEKLQSGGTAFRECYIIRQTFLLLGKQEGERLLGNLYSDENISRWKRTGKSLASSYRTVKIPLVNVKEKVRRRGYHETSSNKQKTHSFQKNKKGDPVIVKKSPESIELEETKQRILLKQAKLFEQRLDEYLRISDPELSPSQKKEVFNRLVEVPESQYQYEESHISENTKQEE